MNTLIIYRAIRYNFRAIACNYLLYIALFYPSISIAVEIEESIALVNQGIELGQSNQSREAIEKFNEVISRFSSSKNPAHIKSVYKSYYNKGVAYAQLQEFDQALEVYNYLI